MFFLYVLKEEKKYPVTQVFEDFIKPLDTSRFTTDYGEDYRKILKKIKRQTHYEKLFNRAIRKIRQFNGNLDGYKSDSCLPLNTGKTWISKEKRKRKSKKSPVTHNNMI